MAITRVTHFASVVYLPDASWSVFFLAGVYLTRTWMLPVLLAEAVCPDLLAVTNGGVSAICVIPAYAFLLPAYGSLWLAGHWYAKRHHFAWSTPLPLASSVIVGALICEMFASGSFYIFSGVFKISLIGFGARLVEYFPPYLGSLALYVGISCLVHAGFIGLRSYAARTQSM